MPKALKQTAVAVAALSALFWWAFMFAKHAPELRPVIPFGDDPYDAVGSFAVIVAAILALISLLRAFLPRREPATDAQQLYLVRSQMAVVLCVWITLAADAVAMVRHRQWMADPSRTELLALLAGLAIVSAAVLLLMHVRPARPRIPAVATVVLSLVALAVYPEQWIRDTGPHLLTVIVGDVLLFAQIRVLLPVFVPRTATEAVEPRHWRGVMLLATAVGVFAFLGEMAEGGPPHAMAQIIAVAVVFVGLSIAGLSVAYAFLGEPLGL